MFVAKIVPGGQSQRAGLKENDKILKINNKVGVKKENNLLKLLSHW